MAQYKLTKGSIVLELFYFGIILQKNTPWNIKESSGGSLKQRESQDFRPFVKVDYLLKTTIQNYDYNQAFA